LGASMWRLARCCLALLRGSSGGGGSLRGRAILLGAAIAAVGLALGGGSASGEATEYSAYDDPEKPAISVILSEEQSVEEFKEKFGLSDAQVEEALGAVRAENEALARAYAESERIVQANEALPADRVANKVAVSDYDEKIRAAIAKTKATIEALVPEDRRPDLRAWVDAKFVQEGQQASEDSAAPYQAASQRKVRCRVFATQYIGYTRYEVALPHKHLKQKFLNGNAYRVNLRRGDHRAKARVKEVGPWNIRDNYWQPRSRRDMWDNLPRCKPQAEAAYFKNHNGGEDQFGREVLNPAGVDLTPRVARRLGLDRYQNAWVYVRYTWARW
jgi:hypothetical protein